jgi:hypothetical protein
MSAAKLHVFAEIAMVIFLLVFVGVAIRVVVSRAGAWDHAAGLPLDDDTGSRPASRQPET